MNSLRVKTSTPKFLLIVFIALCAVLGVSILSKKHLTLQHSINFSDRSLLDQAKIIELEGVMSKSDYVRKEHILAGVKANKIISDSDLAWVLLMLKSKTTQMDNTVSAIGRAQFFEVLLSTGNYSVSQKETVFQAMTFYLSDSNTTDALWSLGIMKHLKDPRATIYLTPLLSSTNPVVRRKAARVIDVLNSPHIR